jgi:hypothetical protein
MSDWLVIGDFRFGDLLTMESLDQSPITNHQSSITNPSPITNRTSQIVLAPAHRPA